MIRFIPAVLFSAFLIFPHKSLCDEQVRKIVSVGVVLHLTGDLAMQSVAFREGLELAAEQVNGSAHNFEIELVTEDGQNNPKISNSAVQKLLNHNRVSALILSSYLDAMASGPLLERKKIPSIILWDSSPEIENVGEYTFAIGPWTPSAGEEAARFSIERLRAKTAVIVTNSDSWSEAVGKFFKQEFEKLGGKVMEEAIFGATETDFRTSISRIRGKSPDIVYSPLVFNLVPFYSQLKQQPLASVIVTSDIIADEHISKAPQAFEGIYQTGLLEPRSATYERMATAYRAKFGKDITLPWFVAVGYDAVHVLANAIQIGGDEIQKSLYSIKNYDGASSVISFNGKGSSPQLEHMYQIRFGKFVLVKDAS